MNLRVSSLFCCLWPLISPSLSMQPEQGSASSETEPQVVVPIAGTVKEAGQSKKSTSRIQRRSVSRSGDFGVKVEVADYETSNMGEDLFWAGFVTNEGSERRTLKLRLTAYPSNNGGSYGPEIKSLEETHVLEPGKMASMEIRISPEDYVKWTRREPYFAAEFAVATVPPETGWHQEIRTFLATEQIDVRVTPSTLYQPASEALIEATFTNPLPMPLTNVSGSIYVGGEAILDNGSEKKEFKFEKVSSKGRMKVSAKVRLTEPGEELVVVSFSADQLHHVVGYASLNLIADCNRNGVDDVADVEKRTSKDCNENEIPDECEPDCDKNGIVDNCEWSALTIIDCNINEIPDSCDVRSGTSKDVNRDGVPDECENDCNVNFVPDFLDILDGESKDANQDGVPDECASVANPTSNRR